VFYSAPSSCQAWRISTEPLGSISVDVDDFDVERQRFAGETRIEIHPDNLLVDVDNLALAAVLGLKVRPLQASGRRASLGAPSVSNS